MASACVISIGASVPSGSNRPAITATVAIIAAERNVAHRIIEEFMLLANETVAQHLDDHEVPTLYRIHEEPDPLKVAEFEEFVTPLGYSLGVPADGIKPRHFQKLVEKAAGFELNAGDILDAGEQLALA